MSNAILHLLKKDTDANASIKGYDYQIIKTIEAWIESSICEEDIDIYCDFEDDILLYSKEKSELRFTQVKLYSRNFSFKSVEVKKALTNFFLLFIKADYEAMERSFVFDCNSNIARQKKDNDAELLASWNENQGRLEGELLSRCVLKCKRIIQEGLQEAQGSVSEDVEAARKEFDNLPIRTWENFANSIAWQFAEQSDTEQAFDDANERVKEALMKLRFHIDLNSLDSLFGVLHKFVFTRAGSVVIEDRKLTQADLEALILNLGDEEAKWYLGICRSWTRYIQNDASNHIGLTLGMIVEVADASKYSRTHTLPHKHRRLWKKVLQRLLEQEVRSKEWLQLVYEYIWLTSFDLFHETPDTNDLANTERLARLVFDSDDSELVTLHTYECSIIYQLLYPGVKQEVFTDINEETLEAWKGKIHNAISERHLEENINKRCKLTGTGFSLSLFEATLSQDHEPTAEMENFRDELLGNLPGALMFDVRSLSNRLNMLIRMIDTTFESEAMDLVEYLEDFRDKLDPFVYERSDNFSKARYQVQRGVDHLKSPNKDRRMRSLDSFHEAKELWKHEESYDGYLLALLNISQVYSAIGLNYAAKYYALSVSYSSLNNGDYKYLKRIYHG